MNGENEYLIRSVGAIYPLGHYGVRVTELGNIPIQYQTQRGYSQHGVTVTGWKLEPRTISVAFELSSFNRRGMWSARQLLIDELNPDYGPVKFRKILPDGSRREIAGWIDASLSMGEGDDPRGIDVGFSLYCPDPTFYDPAQIEAVIHQTPLAAFVVPFSVMTSLSPSEAASTESAYSHVWFGGATQLSSTVINSGSWSAYPRITITGPYDSLAVENQTTGASFSLGVALPAGETVEIVTTPGEQSVMRGGENALSEIQSGTIIGWLIAPGQNQIALSGTGITDETEINLSYNNRYIAI